MSPNEQTYLDLYRKATAKRDGINALVGDFRKLCESFKDWQKAALEMTGTLGVAMRPEWSAESLKEIAKLPTSLQEYGTLHRDLAAAWAELASNERTGFLPPQSLTS